MFIDGKWYTETEIAAYVQELKNKIVSYCQMNVPEYMVPAEVIYLEQIPLNAGKKPDLIELERIYNEGVKIESNTKKKRMFKK